MTTAHPFVPLRLDRLTARRTQRGFALVITLSLLVLLTLLAVGLLTLSSVSLRSVQQGRLMAEARANARVALLLALGQLQRELGPDRRISVPAGILDQDPASPAFDGIDQPRYTGVWEAADSPFTRWTLEKPSYDKRSGFRQWLVSGSDETLRELAAATTGPATGGELRQLVAAGPTPAAGRQVRVPVLAAPQAGFAWWTSDDGTKGVLRAGEPPDGSSRAKILLGAHRAAGDGHSRLDPRIPTRDHGMDDRLVDLATVAAAVPATAGPSRISTALVHDLTTRSETLPVDVTTGGFRKCLNLWLDWLSAQSANTLKSQGAVGPLRNAGMDYRICSWDQLRNYESLARAGSMVTIGSSGRPLIRAHKQQGASGTGSEAEWNPNIGGDRFRIQPVLLKLSYVVSCATERIPAPVDPAKPYALRFYLYPMAVLWNPYNVDLEVPEYCIHGFCPLLFDINKGTTGNARVDLTQNQSATMLAFGPEGGGSPKLSNLVIPAGATKVLYPQEVRWQTNPEEHRHSRFRWHYYLWAQAEKFSLGDANFGGVIKNLRGNQSTAYFNSIPAEEVAGAAGDPLRIEITPSANGPNYAFGMAGAHTDWWGNNGSGTDNAETLQKFGSTTHAYFKVETDGSSPQISVIRESELPVRTFGQLENRPTPLLLFEFYRKAADEDLFPAKTGSFAVAGNPIHALTSKEFGTTDAATPWFESPYSFRFKAISSWFDVTKTFQLPPNRDDRVYFGASYSPRGQLNVVDQEIPLSPLVSLAQLQHLPLFDYRPTYDSRTATATTIWYGGDYGFHEGRVTQFAQNHAIGNSYASPGIPPAKLTNRGWTYQFNVTADHLRSDRSYIANAVLWDAWFCSSIAAQDGLLLQQGGSKRTTRQVAEDFLSGTAALPNDAVTAHPASPPEEVIKSLFDAKGVPTKDAYQKIARHLRIEGGFNVNSVSEEAWAHLLARLCAKPSLAMPSVSGTEPLTVVEPGEDKFLVSRYTLANAPPAEQAGGKERQDRYWNGSRELTAAQLRELAQAIVRQVKQRGPFLSLAEFVNRRLSTTVDLALSGPLQAALDDPQVSINAPFRSEVITGTEGKVKATYPFPAAGKGSRLQGITGYVTQADLLASLGPALSPRSDTFTIRALGEARDAGGVVRASAWCEAVVQRTGDYLDPGDDAATITASLKRPLNQRFGRRFEIVAFRWLAAEEVVPVAQS
jgi:hypothetical protein